MADDSPGDAGVVSAPRRPFDIPDFRRVFVSGVLGFVVFEIMTTTLGWQVYELTHDPFDLGLVGLAAFLPRLLFALPGGYLADHFPRRTVWAWSVAAQCGLAAALLAVTVEDVTAVWVYLLLAFGVGSALAVGSPVARAIAPQIVPKEILAKAMAYRSISFQAGGVAGPPVAGVLIAIAPWLPYLAGLAAGIVAMGGILAVRGARSPVATGSPAMRDVFEGVRFIRRERVVLGAISLDLFAVLFGGAIALLPAFAQDVLHTGAVGFGFLRAAPGIGAVVAALVISRRSVGRHAGRKLLVVVGLFGCFMVVFGLSRSLPLSFLALVGAGASDMVSVVIRTTVVPLVTPGEVLGRVNAVESVFVSASNELGAFESGVAAAVVGLAPAVVVGGVITICVAVAWMRFFPDLADVDRLESLRPRQLLPP